jgi:hypothetical protein
VREAKTKGFIHSVYKILWVNTIPFPQTSLYWPSDFPALRLPCISPLTSLHC